MKIRLDVECHFLVAAYYRDGHALSRSEEKRCVDNIVRLMDFPVSNLEQDVARLNSLVCRRRAIEDLGHFRIGAAFPLQRLHQLRTYPAMPHFAKAEKIAADFFRGFDRQSVTG